MADPAAAPSDDPFDQVFKSPANDDQPDSGKPSDDPFAFMPPVAPASSATGAFVHGAERGFLPAVGSLPAIGAGAEAGAAVGAIGGPIGSLVGGVVGGVGGALAGSAAISAAQDWALSKLPDSWREAIGQDDRQQQLEQKEHGTASFLGGMVPYAVTMRPGAIPRAALPENATALQRIMAHPVTARVFGGGLMGGMELGQEEANGQSPNWTKVAISTGFGMVFNKPTGIGETITEAGARPARRLLGLPEPVTPAGVPPGEQPSPEGAAVESAPAQPAGPPVTARDWNETILGQKPATVAEAGDAKVVGPGVTEDVFMGTADQDSSAAMTAQDARRTEETVTGTAQSEADLHAVARTLEPETFQKYDDLSQQRDTFRNWISEYNNPPQEEFDALAGQRAELESKIAAAPRGGGAGGAESRRLRAQLRDVQKQEETLTGRRDAFTAGTAQETPELAQARAHLQAVDYEMRDLAPHVAAAYRRAADYSGSPVVEPPAPEVAPEAPQPAPAPEAGQPSEPAAAVPPEPGAIAAPPTEAVIADQKAFIANDVAQKLIAAGRPPEEARASGQLIAARYETRAGRLGGKAGTAEELYRREGAEIQGPGGTPYRGGFEPPPTAEPAPSLAPEIEETAAEPVQAVTEAVQKINALTPAQQKRELPTFTQDTDASLPPVAKDQPAGVFMFNPTELNVDAERFQFKSGGDQYGVTGALRGVSKWDPAKAQSIIVWEQNDGTLFVADGHQRAGLARRLTEEGKAKGVQLPGVLYREKDGVSADDIRSIAAVTNIANGSGTALDGAKVLRARPDLMDGSLPLSVGKGKQAAALARLGDEPFRMVVNDVVPEHYAAVVGDLLPNDPDRQVAAMKAIARFEPKNVEEATALTQRVAQAELAKAEEGKQTSMFGDLDTAESTAGEEMKIVGRAIKDLQKDKALFSRVISNAERIESTGSRIERGAAQSVATDSEIFAKVLASDAYSAGPVRTALVAAAKDLRDGKATVGDAASQVHAALRQQVEENGLNRPRDLGREPEPADAELFQSDLDWTPGGGSKTTTLGDTTIDYGISKDGKSGEIILVKTPVDKRGQGSARRALEAMTSAADAHGTTLFLNSNPMGNGISKPKLDAFYKSLGFVKNTGRNKDFTSRAEFVRQPDQSKELFQELTPDERRAAFQEQVAKNRERHDAARRVVDAALATDKPKVTLQKGDEKLLLSAGFGDHPYRITSFDKQGPVGHRDYGTSETDRNQMAGEIVSALHRGFTLGEKPVEPQFEPGAEGKPQQLIPGVAPLTQREQIQAAANKPLAPKKAQKEIGGLFGDTMDQKELFQTARGGIVLNPRGAPGRDFIGVENTKPIIRMMKEANASTFIHESGHQFLAELLRDSDHPHATDILKDDAQTVRDWLKIKDPEDIKTRHHEKFARGFEQYMREGVAPSPELAGVFAKFKNWLVSIYNSIKGLGPEINPDIREVFDRLITMEPQRTVIAPEKSGGPTLADIHEADAREIEPHEADAAMTRIAAETVRAETEIPPEVKVELETELARDAAANAGAERAGEVGDGAGQPAAVAPGGVQPKPEPEGGAVREGSGAVVGGGGAAGREGASVSGGQQPVSRADAGSPLAPSPSTLFGPAESPFADKAGNIRLDNLTSREDVAKAIRDAADANDDFIGDRRGVVTDGQVMELADALGMDFDQLMRRKVGDAFNAEQVVAARKLLIQSATDVSAAMKKAAVGTDEDVMAYAMAKDRHQMIQAQIAGITAEAGRALRAFRDIKGSTEVQAADQFVKAATGKTLFQLREEAKLGSSLDTPQQVSKFMNDAQRRTFGRMVLEYWINGLISGPSTHVTYMIGNTILALHKAGPETAAAALIGRAARALGREGDTVQLGEVGAQLRGAIGGIAPALKASAEAFRTGMTTLLPGEDMRKLPGLQPGQDLAPAARMDEAATYRDAMTSAFSIVRGLRDGIISGGALLKAGGVEGAPLIGAQYSPLGSIPDIAVKGVNVLPVGTLIRTPGRFIAAIHSLFRSVNYSMDKNARAYRAASEEGLTGTAFDARVADLRQNPTPEIMEGAREEATQLTLMGQGSNFTKALSRLTNTDILGFPILKFIDPFVHISGNIIEQSLIQRTPFGLLAPELRADLAGKNGSLAQDKAAARMLVGTAMSITFGALAGEGMISGSEPPDPKAAATWRLAGNQAHSVRIGDIWYDVHRLGPLGMLMSIAADMYDVSHKASNGDMLDAASHLQHAFTQNILDESFMRGPSDLIKAIEDPGRYGESYLRNFVSSFVPFSVGMAQMARAADPYSRRARTVMDQIKSKVPGLSETLPARIDIWGNPVPSRETLGAPGVTAIYETAISHDPVNQALWNLSIYPAAVSKKIRNVELTPAQYDEYAQISGRMTKARLDAIVRSPDFATWPNQIRHDVISETIRQTREVARGLMMGKHREIIQQATQMKLAKMRGEKPK